MYFSTFTKVSQEGLFKKNEKFTVAQILLFAVAPVVRERFVSWETENSNSEIRKNLCN